MTYLFNVFMEPRAVFTQLQERNNWKDILLPLLITVAVGLVSMIFLGDLLIDVQLEQVEKYIMNSAQIPEDQKEERLAESLSNIRNPSPLIVVLGFVSGALSTPVRILMMALIVMLIGNFFFGGKSTYITIVTMTAYTYMITVVEALVKVPLMVTQWRVDIHTGLGLLGIGEQGDFIYNFLSGMDLFAFWRVVVLAIGMNVLYRRDFRSFFIALSLYWILQTAFFTFIGTLFS